MTSNDSPFAFVALGLQGDSSSHEDMGEGTSSFYDHLRPKTSEATSRADAYPRSPGPNRPNSSYGSRHGLSQFPLARDTSFPSYYGSTPSKRQTPPSPKNPFQFGGDLGPLDDDDQDDPFSFSIDSLSAAEAPKPQGKGKVLDHWPQSHQRPEHSTHINSHKIPVEASRDIGSSKPFASISTILEEDEEKQQSSENSPNASKSSLTPHKEISRERGKTKSPLQPELDAKLKLVKRRVKRLLADKLKASLIPDSSAAMGPESPHGFPLTDQVEKDVYSHLRRGSGASVRTPELRGDSRTRNFLNTASTTMSDTSDFEENKNVDTYDVLYRQLRGGDQHAPSAGMAERASSRHSLDLEKGSGSTFDSQETLPRIPMSAKRRTSLLGVGRSLKDGFNEFFFGTSPSDDLFDVPPFDDSPYSEVRACVPNEDEPELTALCLRTIILGFSLNCAMAAANAFLTLRSPTVYLTAIIFEVLSLPLGNLMAFILPDWRIEMPEWFEQNHLGDILSLNPGPFTIKEHCVVTMMCNIGVFSMSSTTTTVSVSKFFEGSDSIEVSMNYVLSLATFFLAIGLAGIFRRFLIRPANMIWPQALVVVAVLTALHIEEGFTSKHSRYRFLAIYGVGAFLFNFFPSYIFTALSKFCWVCWIAPKNVVLNQLFGTTSGLGLGFLAFDWNVIAYQGSPLVLPWWSLANTFVGFVIAFCIVGPILYYLNVLNTSYLPMISSSLYSVEAQSHYDPSQDSITSLLLTESSLMQWSMGFAAFAAAFPYLLLYHGQDILKNVKTYTKPDDIHAYLMMKYKNVPDAIYLALIIIGLAFALATSAADASAGFPVWGGLVAVIFTCILVLPNTYVYAATGQQLFLNVGIDLISGYIFKGNPIPFLIFKTIIVGALFIGLHASKNLKTAHYLKVPHNISLLVLISGVVPVIMQVVVTNAIIDGFDHVCSDSETGHLICSQANVSHYSSVLWSQVNDFFGPHGKYNSFLWAWLIGAVLPIPFWFASRSRWISPGVRRFLGLVHVPLIFSSAGSIPPASGISFTSWILVGFIFQFWIRRRFFSWWARYTFLLSAAMDVGTIISVIVIFGALQTPKSGSIQLNWWGNSVFNNTVDYQNKALRNITELNEHM